ncbi:hypothetical protein B0H12DRAFT_1141982 [Mycena haematopus]|nr:hypothetical protein B0H12DRAFT_1141982 [Mycena haematopus]
MEAYRAVHTPDVHPPNEFLLLAHNHGMIYDLATSLGLRVSIDHLEGHDDILWFSYTRGGVVQTNQVPISWWLERFAQALGITEKRDGTMRGSLPHRSRLYFLVLTIDSRLGFSEVTPERLFYFPVSLQFFRSRS